MNIVRSVLAALAITAVVAAAAHADEHKKPSGTIEFSGGSVAAGIGYTWGGGSLSYKEKEYPISIDGLSVGGAGASKVTLKGNVYDLKQLADFDGNYAGGGAGSALTVRNQNGVVIEALSTTQGLSLSLATGGANIKTKKSARAVTGERGVDS